MPTGNILRLIPYGRQDRELTSNPEVTLFRSVFRRHTPFARDIQEQPFRGNPQLGQTLRVSIPFTGDFLGRFYLRIVIPPLLGDADVARIHAGYAPATATDTPYFSNGFAYNIVQSVRITADGVILGQYSGKYLQLQDLATRTTEQERSVDLAVKKYVAPDTQTATPSILGNPLTDTATLYINIIPFTSQRGFPPLPIAATRAKNLEVTIQLRPPANLQTNMTGDWTCTHPTMREEITLIKPGSPDHPTTLRPPNPIRIHAEMEVQYLAKDERENLISRPQRFLFPSIQERHIRLNKIPTVASVHDRVAGYYALDFNNLVTSLFFQFQLASAVTLNSEHANFSRRRLPATNIRDTEPIPVASYLQINGNPMGERDPLPVQYRVSTPQQALAIPKPIPSLNIIPFTLRNSHTGAKNGFLNFSRFDDIRLQFELPEPPLNEDVTLRVYANTLAWIETKDGLVNPTFRN